MKFINFNRYKLSALFNVFNLRKYNFSKIYKYFIPKKHDFYKIFKYLDIRRYNLFKYLDIRRYNLFKYLDIRRYNLFKILKYFDVRRYNLNKFFKYFNYKKYNHFFLYSLIFLIFSGFIYLSIPWFYNYEKLKLEKMVCKDFNLKCAIKGEVKYSLFPSPRLKLKDFVIKDFANSKRILAKIENVEIILSFYNLLNKKNFNYTKAKFNNSEINFDLNNFNSYKNFFNKIKNSKPIKFTGGNINFIEGKKNITSITSINVSFISKKDKAKGILKGNILNDKIHVNFVDKKNLSKTFTIKLINFGLLANLKIIDEMSLANKAISGNFSIKKGKNKLKAIFDYKDNKIIVKHSNLKNVFLDGKMDGDIAFSPYFNFDLNLNLSSVNFNRLYNSLISLDKESKEGLFKINKKINGNLTLNIDKIFSRYTLINSIESRIKFVNGDVFVEQALFNLGKIGAADMEGKIINDKKFSNFKFENNIFIDNLKRFHNKFGIYGKDSIPYNLFISGNFDLVNLILRINEIFDDKKFETADVEYIEKEFNDIVMEDGYKSLFNFNKLKEFVKIVTSENS